LSFIFIVTLSQGIPIKVPKYYAILTATKPLQPSIMSCFPVYLTALCNAFEPSMSRL
jgi:hypothetical protein